MRPILLAVAIAASAGAGAAQQAPPVPALADALAALPDHRRYRVELPPSDMPPDRARLLAQMIGDAARGRHFFGAVYGYRPAAGERTEFRMRHGLHSRDAARRGALADCEAARTPDDGACALVGEVLPEALSDAAPQLNHLAVQALRETAARLGDDAVVARSRDGDAFAIHAGGDVRDAALAECNAALSAAGLPQDCEIVVAPPAS